MISLITLLSTAAHAFCGTYVGGAGAALTNVDSRVVLVRDGTRTTLTLASDVSGDIEDFAMLVPVPVVLGEGDVRTVDPGVLDRIDTCGAPRLVAYTCDSLHGRGDSGWDDHGDDDIVVLSAEEAGDLLGWLGESGYAVSSDAEEMIQA